MVSIKSDIGMVRKHNEDYTEFVITDEYELYIVADGMGGHNAGDVASKMAVENIINFVAKNFKHNGFDRLLEEAVKYANSAVYGHSNKNSALRGMGTTVVCALKVNDFMQIANVGDSSAYSIKNNQLKKITRDHSLVQELLDGGSITEEEAKSHPKKNVITRAVGTGSNVMVDIFEVNKENYDNILLCTDGLSNDLTKEEIEKALTNFGKSQNISEILVEMAKANGGKDNITAMLFGGEV